MIINSLTESSKCDEFILLLLLLNLYKNCSFINFIANSYSVDHYNDEKRDHTKVYVKNKVFLHVD